MSLFDGVTGLFEGVFDCSVTLHLDGADDVLMRGIFREEPGEVADLDGNDTVVVSPVLKLREEFAVQLERGSRVSVSSRPGEVFMVTAIYPTRSPAQDRHHLAMLTEVDPA
ncbi:hypothetical protein AAFO90_17010 [Phaeobacter sp. CAU 1743]|uniref:head-tail joining protein n=1 Tax=Phaeobacter sp. CAU 1743 TaxID=3140367 RepID=UPI00325AFBCC